MKTSWSLRFVGVLCLFFAIAICNLRAGSATWLQNPADGNWNNPANWTAGGPPNSHVDQATFAASDRTGISVPTATEVGEILFNVGATPFVVTASPTAILTISNSGIHNNSGITQNFVTAATASGVGEIHFRNAATAFFSNSFVNSGGAVSGQLGGVIAFFDSAMAGDGSFENNGGITEGSLGGLTQFQGNSNAGNGVFVNKSGASVGIIFVNRPEGGVTQFFDNSSAGTGVFITHGGAQQFSEGAFTQFYDNSSAGNALLITNGGEDTFESTPGVTEFHDSSTAYQATLFCNESFDDAYEATIAFYDNSSAGASTITIKRGSGDFSNPGALKFHGNSTAGDATIINEGASNSSFFAILSGHTDFYDDATAGNATLIAKGGMQSGALGGRIRFLGNSSASTARVELLGNGSLSCSQQTVGSIEGTGIIYAGNLSVGSNNLSTTFSGVINGGSLTKIGSTTLTLAGANTYSGLTTVASGKLQAAHDGALGNSDVALTMAGAILSLQGGTANNYIFDAGILSVVTGSTVNLNFKGTPDVVGFLVVNGVSQPAGIYGGPASGAPHQLPQFTGAGTILVATPVAISRKLQGATNFDMNLPFTGASSIECRSGGANNAYQIITTFGFPVTFNNATITSGTGNIANVTGNGTATVTINLIGVTNAQTLTVTLSGMNYGVATGDLPIRMGVLIGDTNGNGSVNASDVSQTKAQAGQPITSANFREDVNGNGVINASDVAFVKSKSGTSLP